MSWFYIALHRVDATGQAEASLRVEFEGSSRREAARTALVYHPHFNRAEVTHIIQPNGNAVLLPTKVTVYA